MSFIKALPFEERMGFEALKAVIRAGLPCTEPFQRVEHSELGDEVLGVLVHALWQDVVAAEDFVFQFELIFAMEKRIAGQALEDDSAEAPKVRAEGRDLVHQHLRRHVQRRAYLCVGSRKRNVIRHHFVVYADHVLAV